MQRVLNVRASIRLIDKASHRVLYGGVVIYHSLTTYQMSTCRKNRLTWRKVIVLVALQVRSSTGAVPRPTVFILITNELLHRGTHLKARGFFRNVEKIQSPF
jgi:hypothetical protein